MWLLEVQARQALEQAIARGITSTVEQQQALEALHGGEDGNGGARILTVVGDTAQIDITGVLTPRPDFIASLFGGGNTTYAEIIAAAQQADANSDVKQIILKIDSPGGAVAGLFDAIAALQAVDTPIRAEVGSLAASAAFALMAQADTAVATSRAARFGSIGIVARFDNDDNEIVVRSSKAPKKQPDVSTEEGVAAIREELDDMHELFVEAIAAGRGTTTEKINTNFGQGATLLADKALKHGMIDKVAEASASPTPAAPNRKTTKAEAGPMDLAALKVEHPAVYAQACEEAVTTALAAEQDRVNAHLIAGEGSGDMKTALAAIVDGSAMTSALQTTYMMAAANKANVGARQGDDDDAGDDTGGDEDAQAKASSENIMKLAAEACNVELEA